MFTLCGRRKSMASEVITKEKMDFTIDVLVTMIVDELAETTGKDRNEILPEFVVSKTGKALYDISTKLWCNGPSYIVDMYLDEIQA